MYLRNAIAAITITLATSAFAQSEPVQLSNLSAMAGPTTSYSYIVGTATNTTNRNLSSVFVHFNLYDEQNALVGNTIAMANNLGVGETWKFTANALVPYHHFTVSKIDISN